MKSILTITSNKLSYLELKSIDEKDIDVIRIWKNEHREYFFLKDIISEEKQRKWFESYIYRENDYILKINLNGKAVGCIGFRLLDPTIDIYNVILGVKEIQGKGVMSDAIKMLCYFLKEKYNKDITAKVLINNPAIDWYKKNGFIIADQREDYYIIKLETLLFSGTINISND